MPPSAGKYLRDLLDAARLAVSFVDGKTFADYESDILIRSAVERQLTILCEAMSQLDHHHPELTAQITDCDAIIGMRIVLVHRYADLDNRRVWDTVALSLPVLIEEVSHLLDDV